MSKKVLIADDADVIRAKLSEFFVAQNFIVIEAADGKQGMQRMSEHDDIALVLADLNMPFADGLELTKHIRALPAHKATPVFILSTESSSELKAKGKQSGVSAWILKPFDAANMIEMLKILGLSS